MEKYIETDFVRKDSLLSLEQISIYCDTPIKRINNWVEKKELNVSLDKGNIPMVHLDDLIDFLVRHNMTIPESIIPVKVRKILFIFEENLMKDEIVLKFLMRFLEQPTSEANLIVDYCTYGPMVKMKLLVFKPDLLILDAGTTVESCEVCHLVKNSEEFEGIKVAAIVESVKINEELKERLGVDALLPRSMDIKILMKNINKIFAVD